MHLDGDIIRDGDGAQQVANAIYVVKPADEVRIAVITINERPDSARVLTPDEVKLLAEGLKEASARIADGPMAQPADGLMWLGTSG